MKKAFKTLFIYLGVLLLAFIATVVFCGAFLFFYRDGNIFGIQYIKRNEILYARENEDMSSLRTIEINAQNFDVNIVVNSRVDNIMGAMRNKTFGYTHKKKAQANFTLEYDETTQTAVFNATEPRGWLSRKNCYIEIVIPEDFADAGYNLQINTDKSDVTIGGEDVLTLGDIIIKNNKGNTSVKNVLIKGSIETDIGSGWLGFDSKCKTNRKIDCEIKVGSGLINFTKVNPEEFLIKTVEIKSIKSGTIGIEKLDELITNGNINSGGKIEIHYVNYVDFSSLDTKVIIENMGVIGTTSTSRLNFTGFGGCKIGNVYSHLQVDGHNGDIVINSATETISLITSEGNIKMNKASKLVSASSEYGNIDITFDDSALDYSPSNISNANLNRAVIATTKNGHIWIKGLQNGRVSASGSGKISLKYDKVVGENVIDAKTGMVSIAVPNPTDLSGVDEYAFNLTVDSKSASDIKVGVVGSIGAVDFGDSGFKNFTNIYGNAGNNNLKVTSNTGTIKIRSNDLSQY